MAKIFIAMENPASWLGHKYQNAGAKPPRRTQPDDKRGLYKQRREQTGLTRIDDTTASKERKLVEGLLSTSSELTAGNDVRLAASGSLRSMLKRLRVFAKSGDGEVDTIVFLGHGAAGNMAVGMGTHTFADDLAEVVKSSEREITLQNTHVWAPLFADIKDCVTTGIRDRVHIFLLGCSTGRNARYFSYERSLTDHLAENLADRLELPVCVYGTSCSITPNDTARILRNLIRIEKDGDLEIAVPETGVRLLAAEAG